MSERDTRKRPLDVAVIGVPMDLGTDLRGVDMGPSAIRIAGVVEGLERLSCRVSDLGNVPVPHASVAGVGESRLRFAAAICEACGKLADAVAGAVANGRTPVVLGGDHSIAMGTVAGLKRREAGGTSGRSIGLLWVDAHADCNTMETTPSGNVHGMPLAAILGAGEECFTRLAGEPPMVDPARAALLGVRSVDEGERGNIERLGVRVYTMREIDERGVSSVMKEALRVVTDGTEAFHVSFDMDVVDPRYAPGVGTPVQGGLTIREAHLVMELVADSGALAACEVVEVNPVLDERNTTAELAAGLVHSALGARIL